jgi:hypothetical protein
MLILNKELYPGSTSRGMGVISEDCFDAIDIVSSQCRCCHAGDGLGQRYSSAWGCQVQMT